MVIRVSRDTPAGNQSFQNRTRQIAFEVIVKQQVRIIDKIAAKLQARLDPVIDNLFRELAEHFMGESEDIYELLALSGSDIVGAAWARLNAKYVHAKGSSAYFSYTDQPIPTSIRLAQGLKKKRFSQKKDQASLITTFKGLSGLRELGGVKIVVTNDKYGIRREISNPNVEENFAQRIYVAASGVKRHNIERVSFRMELQLWGKVKGNLNNIESKLFQGQRDKTFHKLIGKASYQRPLLQPFLEFYVLSVLPNIVNEVIQPYMALDKRGKATLHIFDGAHNVLS